MEEKSDALNEKWYNYCVSESFEPGSTFKPIVVASALEMGAITTDATYVCDGGEFVTDTEIKCDNISKFEVCRCINCGMLWYVCMYKMWYAVCWYMCVLISIII